MEVDKCEAQAPCGEIDPYLIRALQEVLRAERQSERDDVSSLWVLADGHRAASELDRRLSSVRGVVLAVALVLEEGQLVALQDCIQLLPGSEKSNSKNANANKKAQDGNCVPVGRLPVESLERVLADERSLEGSINEGT